MPKTCCGRKRLKVCPLFSWMYVIYNNTYVYLRNNYSHVERLYHYYKIGNVAERRITIVMFAIETYCHTTIYDGTNGMQMQQR